MAVLRDWLSTQTYDLGLLYNHKTSIWFPNIRRGATTLDEEKSGQRFLPLAQPAAGIRTSGFPGSHESGVGQCPPQLWYGEHCPPYRYLNTNQQRPFNNQIGFSELITGW